MKKVLQKTLVLLALFLVSVGAMAQDASFSLGYDNAWKTIDNDGVKVTGWCSECNGHLNPCNPGDYIKFEAPEGKVFTQITLTVNKKWSGDYENFVADCGSFTASLGDCVWTGSSSSVTFSRSNTVDIEIGSAKVWLADEGSGSGSGGGSVTPQGNPDAEFTFNKSNVEAQNDISVNYYFWNANQCANPYDGHPMTFTSNGKKIVRIELAGSYLNLINSPSNLTTQTTASIVWEGEEQSVSFASNDADGGRVTSARVWLKSSGSTNPGDNVPEDPSIPVYNAVQVQNVQVGKVYTLTMYNYSQQEYPLILNAGKVVPTLNGNPILFKCGDNGDGFYLQNAEGMYLRNPHPLGNWVNRHSETGLSSTYDTELVPLSFEAVPSYGSNITSSNAANNSCVAIRQARGYDGSSGPLLMGYTTFSNTGSYSGSGAIYYNNASTSAFILREVQAFPTSTLGQEGEDYYGTYYANHAWEIPAGYEAYVVTGVDGGQMTLEEVTGTVVGANTAVILKGARSENLPIQFSLETGYTNANNMLRGAVEDFNNIHEDGYKYYVMTYAQGGGNLGFYWQYGSGDGSTVNCGAHKAYLRVPVAGGASNGFRFRFDDVTAIETIATEKAEAIYNLQGQRVNATKAGVYVKNGKKFIVK